MTTLLSPYQTRWAVAPEFSPHQSMHLPAVRTPAHFLDSIQHMPALTAALGTDLSGTPVLLDFLNTSIFPVCVFASADYRLALIETLLLTASTTSSPAEFKYAILSSKPEDFQPLCDIGFVSEHCLGMPYTLDEAREWMLEFANWSRRRYFDHLHGAVTLMIIDDLHTQLLVDGETHQAWQWLIHEGPQTGFLTLLASESHLSTSQKQLPGAGALDIYDKQALRLLQQVGTEPAINIHQAQFGHFYTRTHGNWLSFTNPALLPE